MKNRTLILALLIALAVSITLSFVKKENNTSCCSSTEKNEKKIAGILDQDKVLNKEEIIFGINLTERKTVTKEKLKNAKLLEDFVSGYPSNWIKNYENVEIKVTKNGVESSATGKTSMLNKEQRRLLQNADWTTIISVTVAYEIENVITKESMPREMKVSMSVVPPVSATFEGGKEKLITYFENNSEDKIDITKIDSIEIKQQSISRIPGVISVYFVINEEGKPENVILQVSSNVPETDKFILNLLKGMPTWKPARDAKGKAVKQAFELVVGGPSVGC